jgi:pimeloyl-ACP methyl ester carboxylesterase
VSEAATTITADGADLHVEERGSGPPVVFLHGMAGSTAVWGEVLDQLAETHRVIAYDRRGHTRSTGSEHTDHRRNGEDAAEVIRALDAAPATLIGWSSGGIIALDVAVHHPDLVSSLVIVEAPLHAAKRPGIRQLRAFLTARLRSRRGDDRAGAETFLRWAFRYRTGGTAYDRLPETMRAGMLANASAAMAELDVGTGEHLSVRQIEGIYHPVVLVLGELSDNAFVRATNRLAKRLPRARIERIPGTGHLAHLERPAEVARTVREAARTGETS